MTCIYDIHLVRDIMVSPISIGIIEKLKLKSRIVRN